MFFKKSTLLSVSAAALLASPAFADLKTHDVWADMETRAKASGGTLTATAIKGSTYEGVVYSYAEEDADFKVNVGTVTFIQNTPDSVFIQYEDKMTGTIVVEDISGYFMVTNQRLDMEASDQDGAIKYDYKADKMDVEFHAVLEEGYDQGNLVIKAELDDMEGSTMMIDEGDHLHATSHSKLGTLDLKFTADMTVDDTTDTVSGDFSVDDLEAEYIADLSGDMKKLILSPMTDEALLDDVDSLKGITMKQDVTYGNMSMSFREEREDDASGTFFAYDTGPGAADFLLEETGVHYSAEVDEASIKVIPTAMPIPVTVTMETLSSKASIPFPADEFVPNQVSPMELGFEMTKLTLGEEAWGMIDPMGMFDHSPITFTTNISGDLNWGEEEDFDQYEVAFPESIEIKDVTFEGLGVFASIAGEMLFNGEPSADFDGLPAPTGEVKVVLKGFEDLFQRLTQSGMVDPGMLFMANGVLQTYTAPAGDHRKVDIVFDGQGDMTINGMSMMQQKRMSSER